MRIAVLVLGLMLLALPAWADTDYTVSLDVAASEGYWYFSDGNWYWGGSPAIQGVTYGSAGLTIGVSNEDWGVRFSTGTNYHPYRYPYSQPYSYQSSYRPVERFDSIITPLEPLIEPYTGRSNTVPGRNGYGVAIPRPTGGEPELYGRYEYDEHGRPQPVGSQNIYPTYNPGYYNYRNRPVVMHYSYGYPYYNYNYPGVVYTAPSNPDYGYVRGRTAYPVNDPALYGDRQEIRAEEVNVYQGEVHNHYYEDVPPAPQAPPRETASQAAPQVPQEEPAVAYGTRFYETARLEVPSGVQVFSLREGKLRIGPENGPAQLISDGVRQELGAYASYTDLAGVVVLFAREDRIAAAYATADGPWWVEPLPHAVDFSGKITLGLIGGAPWAVFNTVDGSRYVMVFTEHQWQEVGSGTV